MKIILGILVVAGAIVALIFAAFMIYLLVVIWRLLHLAFREDAEEAREAAGRMGGEL